MRLPDRKITITRYDDLLALVGDFRANRFRFVCLLSSPGLGKSFAFHQTLMGLNVFEVGSVCTAFQLYVNLFERRDADFIVLNDADSLMRDSRSRPLLKRICEADETRVLEWQSRAIDQSGTPSSYSVHGRVAILCNSWDASDADMAAVIDRAIFVLFKPSVAEIHRQAETFVEDREVYDFIGQNLHLATDLSFRVYEHALELKGSSLPWRENVLQLLATDSNLEIAREILENVTTSTADQVREWQQLTARSRATFFRYRTALIDSGLVHVADRRGRRTRPPRTIST